MEFELHFLKAMGILPGCAWELRSWDRVNRAASGERCWERWERVRLEGTEGSLKSDHWIRFDRWVASSSL